MILGPLNVHQTLDSLDLVKPKKKVSYVRRERMSRPKSRLDFDSNTDTKVINGSSVTPSMSAVISQVRQFSKVLERESKVSNDELLLKCNKRKLSDDSPSSSSPLSSNGTQITTGVTRLEQKTVGPGIVEAFTDPLQQPQSGNPGNSSNNNNNSTGFFKRRIQRDQGTLSASNKVPEPQIEMYNMQDLDLADTLVPSDIITLIPPIYKRNTQDIQHRYKGQNKNKNKNKDIQSHSLHLETPRELDLLSHDNHEQATILVTASTPRKRQRSMNPNFLKLMAIENSSIKNEILPEVVIDDMTFNRLAQPVGAPGAITVEELEYPDDVKLAIKTKLKIWDHMSKGILRSDVFGDALPSRLNFVNVCGGGGGGDTGNTESTGSSIVRVNSDVTPWVRGGSSSGASNRMLQPCGTLSCGSQYVVKGWCDARFR